jgi:uncharacterized membrane protein YkvA (DUF1232 family)
VKIRSYIRFLKAVWGDERTPWYARAVLAVTLAYALSPIDLIPDFVPGIGHLDDVIVVGLGCWLARRLVPREVWFHHRERTLSREGQAEPK